MSHIPGTAAFADACVQLGVALRIGPVGLLPAEPGWRVHGPARPVLHLGSVDVFLEACESLTDGDVLVVDDGGRTDRACVGDLTAIEVLAAGGVGLVVDGCHRDSAQLRAVGLPVFSLGPRPNGPHRVEPAAPGALPRLGEHVLEPDDWIVGDEDGVLLQPGERAEEIRAAAEEIAHTEGGQANAVRAGRSLREQLGFAEYLRVRAETPGYTLREHLRRRGGAIER